VSDTEDSVLFLAGGVTEADDAWSITVRPDCDEAMAIYVGIRDLSMSHPDGYAGYFSPADAMELLTALTQAVRVARPVMGKEAA
jgi:hypothetical protein